MNQSEQKKKREFWRSHIEQQKKSGQSCIEYCREKGLKKEHFHYYNGVLNRKPKEPVTSDFINIRQATPSKVFSMQLANGVNIECQSNTKLLNEVLKIIIESN